MGCPNLDELRTLLTEQLGFRQSRFEPAVQEAKPDSPTTQPSVPAVLDKLVAPGADSPQEADSTSAITSYQAWEILQGRGDGLRCGEWVIRLPLGRGGMGEVFLARHVSTGQWGALKRPHRRAADVPGHLWQRFVQEVTLLSQMPGHDGLPKVYDFSLERDKAVFFTMEFIFGANLHHDVVHSGPLHIDQALFVARGVLEVLQLVHIHNVIHRDVKPVNIIMHPRRGPVLVDFGIAKVLGVSRGTQPGSMLGDPYWMSPEQFNNPAQVDVVSDVYSFGCTLFFALTGQYPFTGNWNRLKEAHTCQPPPRLLDYLADASRGDPRVHLLDRLVAWMLQKRPDDRPTATQLLRELPKRELTSPTPGEAVEGYGGLPGNVAVPEGTEEQFEFNVQLAEALRRLSLVTNKLEPVDGGT